MGAYKVKVVSATNFFYCSSTTGLNHYTNVSLVWFTLL